MNKLNEQSEGKVAVRKNEYILPCPFCGGQPEWINLAHPSGIPALCCSECQFSMQQDRRDKTIFFWNRRAAPSAVEGKEKEVQHVPYQLCPKCHGDGNLLRYNSPSIVSTDAALLCDVCNGAKVIPQYQIPTYTLSTTKSAHPGLKEKLVEIRDELSKSIEYPIHVTLRNKLDNIINSI